MTKEEIKEALLKCTSIKKYHRLNNLLYTDGIKILVDNGGDHFLLHINHYYNLCKKIKKGIDIWKIERTIGYTRYASIILRGDGVSSKIKYKSSNVNWFDNMPDKVEILVSYDGTLLIACLPSEYGGLHG